MNHTIHNETIASNNQAEGANYQHLNLKPKQKITI